MVAMIQGKCDIPGFRYGEYRLPAPAKTTAGTGPAVETGTIRGYSQVNEA
jgi:hypothetical protein